MYDGIFIVDKPEGLTSHDVVLFLRRHFGIKKVGHAGTLDPLATGVLVLLLGRATKLSSHFMSDEKEYQGVLQLGIRTDSHDSQGKVLSAIDPSGLTNKIITDTFNSFSGVLEQIPPMVSAVKYKGRRLYKLAREGINVKPKPRKITIYDIRVEKIEMPKVWFLVRCSKGTYIRKLVDDIGQRLGCGAHLTSLRRTRSGTFSIDGAVSFENLREFDRRKLEEHLKIIS